MINFMFLFMLLTKGQSSFFFCTQISNCFSTTYWKRLSFPHWIALTLLLKINWPYSCEIISRVSVLFHWCVCLSLHQIFIIYYIQSAVYYLLYKKSKISVVIRLCNSSPFVVVLFFFLKRFWIIEVICISNKF